MDEAFVDPRLQVARDLWGEGRWKKECIDLLRQRFPGTTETTVNCIMNAVSGRDMDGSCVPDLMGFAKRFVLSTQATEKKGSVHVSIPPNDEVTMWFKKHDLEQFQEDFHSIGFRKIRHLEYIRNGKIDWCTLMNKQRIALGKPELADFEKEDIAEAFGGAPAKDPMSPLQPTWPSGHLVGSPTSREEKTEIFDQGLQCLVRKAQGLLRKYWDKITRTTFCTGLLKDVCKGLPQTLPLPKDAQVRGRRWKPVEEITCCDPNTLPFPIKLCTYSSTDNNGNNSGTFTTYSVDPRSLRHTKVAPVQHFRPRSLREACGGSLTKK